MKIPPIQTINPDEARTRFDQGALLIDVRTPEEQSHGRLKGSICIDSKEVVDRVPEFGSDKEKEILVFCKSGYRSEKVAEFLMASGFKNVENAGGFEDLVPFFEVETTD